MWLVEVIGFTISRKSRDGASAIPRGSFQMPWSLAPVNGRRKSKGWGKRGFMVCLKRGHLHPSHLRPSVSRTPCRVTETSGKCEVVCPKKWVVGCSLSVVNLTEPRVTWEISLRVPLWGWSCLHWLRWGKLSTEGGLCVCGAREPSSSSVLSLLSSSWQHGCHVITASSSAASTHPTVGENKPFLP